MKVNDIQAVILAGGKGTRIREETDITPKPMIKIGKKPVLEHIMKRFMNYQINNFIVCTGYKNEVINQYFANYETSKDFSFNSSKKTITPLEKIDEFNIELLFTGDETNTGGRIFKIRDRIKNDLFMVTYGDGLADVDIKKLVDYHQSRNTIATITVTKLKSRFGYVEIDKNSLITSFKEKERENQQYSIGYMVFSKRVFDYLDDNSVLEAEPMKELAKNNQLSAFEHNGFFEPMDTYREFLNLNELWKKGIAPWDKY